MHTMTTNVKQHVLRCILWQKKNMKMHVSRCIQWKIMWSSMYEDIYDDKECEVALIMMYRSYQFAFFTLIGYNYKTSLSKCINEGF